MPPGSRIADVSARALDAAMNEPFEIATGSKTEVRNVLVRVRLEDGTSGYGEGAPSAAGLGSQAGILRAVMGQRDFLAGKDIDSFRALIEGIEERLPRSQGPARAALQMAVLDAWARRANIPLRLLFGGAEARVSSDVTVTLVHPERAREAARRIVGMGIRTIKIKVGRDIEEDLERITAAASAAPRLRLLLDANCGYGPSESLKLLRKLKRLGIVPVLFEQPAAREDLSGLKDVHRFSGVPVAADESAAGREEALKIARLRAAQVVNVKLMKCGILEAWDIALICRAAGLGLMIGGMVESTLAMTCAAHLAAGLGGFDFVDLDTPLWFARDPMRGVRIGRGGVYDLSGVRAGIGVVPGPSLRF